MNTIEKVAQPRTLSKHAWYIRLHKWIGWGYPDKNFCPFFWLTVLGCAVAPGLLVWHIFVKILVATVKVVLDFFGWCFSILSAIGCFLSSLVPQKIADWWAKSKENPSYDELAQKEWDQWYARVVNSSHYDILLYDAYAKTEHDSSSIGWRLHHHIDRNLDKLIATRVEKLNAATYQTSRHEEYQKLKNQWKNWQEEQAAIRVKRQGIMGTMFIMFAVILIMTVIGSHYHDGAGTVTLFVLKWFSIIGGFIATIAGLIFGGPLIYGYWKDVFLQKYCPEIKWIEDEESK